MREAWCSIGKRVRPEAAGWWHGDIVPVPECRVVDIDDEAVYFLSFCVSIALQSHLIEHDDCMRRQVITPQVSAQTAPGHGQCSAP